ncbi:AsnC family transcriptional regulator [Bradyrhizobium ottawaense]
MPLCVKQALLPLNMQGSRMDQLDVKLLQALKSDGRSSTFDLADLVGLSARWRPPTGARRRTTGPISSPGIGGRSGGRRVNA